MSQSRSKTPVVRTDALFDRIVSILEQARGNVLRAVNTNMALAYWLIGREIVEEIQLGKGGQNTVRRSWRFCQGN